uniref:FAD/NAD(P)-binding domain-containing protein n=1 Tax=Bionectria ochroleuca TaxID=29856 RepID=A0A8H7K6B5_BIOOC
MAYSNGNAGYVARRHVDTTRPLKVVIVGAGISGIISAIKLLDSVQNLNMPAHTYQLSWDHNAAWTQFYATAPEILKYWKRVAEKYDIKRYMKFSHRATEARWDESAARWAVTLQDKRGHTVHDDCDVFISAVGILNAWDWPSIPGLGDYKGKLMYSAAWDTSFDLEGKSVAVIGAGSSGIQIVPNIQPMVKRLDHYVRGKTWIATPIADQELKKRGQVETTVQTGFQVTLRASIEQNEARPYFETLMAQCLSKKPTVLSHILPDFPPFCKRLTPGPGYLEALTEENSGILTTDNKHREVDAIVCATGFNTSFTNRFPVYGIGGALLFGEERQQQYRCRLSTYLSTAVDGFPNFFLFLGPNSGVGHGNLLMIVERLADYCAKTLRKMQTQDILTIQPRMSAVDSFSAFCEEYFKETVFSADCSSWYKIGGKVAALWPGSSLHAIKTLEEPRWEDFEYTFLNDNPTAWLGDGSTEADHDPNADKTYYLTSTQLIKDNLAEKRPSVA